MLTLLNTEFELLFWQARQRTFGQALDKLARQYTKYSSFDEWYRAKPDKSDTCLMNPKGHNHPDWIEQQEDINNRNWLNNV